MGLQNMHYLKKNYVASIYDSDVIIARVRYRLKRSRDDSDDSARYFEVYCA